MPIIQPPGTSFQQLSPQPTQPGLGARLFSSMGQGIAGILAAMQQQKENEYREQQLAQQAAQQQALEAYYQGTLGVQQGQLSAQTTEQAIKMQGQRQVGGAMQAALGMPGQVAQPQVQPIPPQPGNATQSMQPGVFQEVLGAAASQLAPGVQQIFGGVAPEHMGAAVKGVQEVQDLQPKAPELPTSGKEFEYLMRLAKSDPQRALLYKQLFLDKQPSTVVNVGEGEQEYDKATAKARVDFLMETTKTAKSAVQGFASIDGAYRLVDKSITGIGANAQLGVARVLSKMGVKPSANAVENSQAFLKLTGESQLDYLRGRELGSGTAVSDGDREFTARLAASNLTLDAGAIKKILRINAGVGIMKVQDAINELRDQSIAYPQRAVDLNRQALELERKLAVMRTRYAEMLQTEGVEVEGIRGRLSKMPGIQLP